MRKFLLWSATMCVGGATLMAAMAMSTGDSGAFLAGVLVWLVALGIGLVLSAPAFLDPPDSPGGLWSFRVPVAVWLFLMLVKLTSWIGFYILLGAWSLIFRIRNQHGAARPTFAGPPPAPAHPPAQAAHSPAYPAHPSAYPAQPSADPARSPGYPIQPSGYPARSPGHPIQPSGYPAYAGPSPARAGGPVLPQASWQNDPTGRYQRRWWDGHRWTDRVTTGGYQAVDPL
ncbi:hypothetical protein [Actinoplanes sp. NPDC049265]|uniref:hypothetical protein n=1 Tax=Actinoplanes sp. NPDC049265 TaxID=3363902 RepID=UPI00372417FA